MHDDLQIVMETAAQIRPREIATTARRRLAVLILYCWIQAASSWLGTEFGTVI